MGEKNKKWKKMEIRNWKLIKIKIGNWKKLTKLKNGQN